jgi:hypothetical protein
MDSDRTALEGLRRDLLTAGADRKDTAVHIASEWSERERIYAPDDDYDPAFDIDYDDPDWEEHFENAMRMRDELKAKGVATTRREVREKKELERALQSGELSSAESGLTLAALRPEARLFIAEQECDDLGELLIRAQWHAERVSSTLPARQSRTHVAAFIEAVRHEAGDGVISRHKMSARTASLNDFPADLMYLE